MWLLAILAALLLFIPTVGKEQEKTNDIEERTANLCSLVEGVGECQVMVTYRQEQVYAVAVICEGAEITEVRRDVTNLITSLYGIGTNRVEILPMR
jgi:hypothetical protein